MSNVFSPIVLASGGRVGPDFAAMAKMSEALEVAPKPTRAEIRFEVVPGQVLTLPVDTAVSAARLDTNGDLFLQAGETLIILIGYAAASAEAPVIVQTTGGIEIDIASLLAAASGTELDIETAAGSIPAPGEADNNGGIFAPFDPRIGIGGLVPIGGLNPTALNYGLVERDAAPTPLLDRAEVTDASAGNGTGGGGGGGGSVIDVPGIDCAPRIIGEPEVTITLTKGPDVYSGDERNELIQALQQNDIVAGGGGDDTILGQEGRDTLYGNDGNDKLIGGNGKDELSGGAGNDVLYGDDSGTEGNGDDILNGDAGDDALIGGRGADELHGGDGNDCLNGNAGADLYDGGAGHDNFWNIENEDLQGHAPGILGGAGDDVAHMNLLQNFRGNESDNDDAVVRDIEVLDFQGDQNPATPASDGTKIELDAQSVADMTDADKTMFVRGDADDSLTLDNSNGTWVAGETGIQGDDGNVYDVFTALVGPSEVTLFVDDDIPTN